MSGPTSTLRTHVAANYLGQGWAAIMGIAFVPLYVAVLGVESYGLIGVFAILQAWMALLDLGLTPTLNREMARLKAGSHTAESIRDLLRSLEWLYALLTVAMVTIVWALAPALATDWLNARALPSDTLIQALRIMGFVLALRIVEQIYRSALQGAQDQVWLNVALAVLATFRWAGAYAVVTVVSPTIAAFFVWQGIASIVSIFVLTGRTYCVLPRASRPGRFDAASLRKIFRFAGGMFVGSVLGFVLTQVDKVFVSKMLPLDQLGYYMIAAAAAAGLMQLMAPMNAAVFPRLTAQVTSGDHILLKQTYFKACEWMAAIIVAPALVLTFFANPVVLLWTGDHALTHHVAPLLAVLALGTLCNGLMNIPYMLQLAYGWTDLAIRVNLVAVCIVVPVISWAVPRYGAIGAAVTWLALNVGYLVVGIHFMYQRVLPDAKWSWYRGSVVRPLLGGCAAAIALRASLPNVETRLNAALYVALSTVLIFAAVIAVLPNVRKSVVRVIVAPRRLFDA